MDNDATVSELAEELGVPTSEVLDSCHRLGIDATWAGSRLSPVATVLLRKELGTTPTPTDRHPSPSGRHPVASEPSGWAGGLPPTAVGSLPGASGPGPTADEHRSSPSGGSAGAGRDGGDDPSEGAETSRSRPASPPVERRGDRGVRTALVAATIGVILVVVAPWSPHVVLTVAAWLGVGLAGLVAVVAGYRARYRISTHPEKLSGLAPAVGALVVGVLLLVVLAAGGWIITRGDPPPEAVGDRDDVTELRWTFARVRRIVDEGWHRPAKDVGTCWSTDDDQPRHEERIEVGDSRESCTTSHEHEVLAVFQVDPDADAPYPGAEALAEIGRRRCEPVIDAIDDIPEDLQIHIEIPTAAGWDDADHDVTCVAQATRSGSLTG